MPKCTVCGEEVTDIGPLDVPYHVECVMVAWHRALNPLGPMQVQAECDRDLVLVPVLRTPSGGSPNGRSMRSPTKTMPVPNGYDQRQSPR